MPNKLIVSETLENLSMATSQRMEFTCELPFKSNKEMEKLLHTVEMEVKKLGGDDVEIHSNVDGITESGYTITFKIETKLGDTNMLKKEIWFLLGEKQRAYANTRSD